MSTEFRIRSLPEKTAAFGYRAQALVFLNSVLERGSERPLANPRHAPPVTAGDGLAHQVGGADVRSAFLNICSDCLWSRELPIANRYKRSEAFKSVVHCSRLPTPQWLWPLNCSLFKLGHLGATPLQVLLRGFGCGPRLVISVATSGRTSCIPALHQPCLMLARSYLASHQANRSAPAAVNFT